MIQGHLRARQAITLATSIHPQPCLLFVSQLDGFRMATETSLSVSMKLRKTHLYSMGWGSRLTKEKMRG